MIKKELLDKFKKYRQEFTLKEVKVDGDNYYFNNILVDDGTNRVWEGENFILVKYGAKNSISRVLSNLYPMSFKIRGKKVSSIESVLQGIKYNNKRTQAKVFGYSGVDAYHTRACNSFDFWGNDGVVYWQGKPMKRESEDYENLVDEL